MSFFIAIVLGLVQGLTEFFPVSSSAHLKIVKLFMDVGEVPVSFDLACHFGTLAALIWFLRKDISSLFSSERGQIPYFFLALLPLLPAYFLLAPLRRWAADPALLGYFLMLTGVILFLGQKLRFKKEGSKMRDVLLIGTMQAGALIPGISRSASTISAARSLGWDVKKAVRFSFLLAIPTIMGGNFVEILKTKELSNVFNMYSLTGCVTAFIAGLGIIGFAFKILEKGNLKIFAIYCLILGIVAKLTL